MGYGVFSTVWLVNEVNTRNYYALKVLKSKENETALEEIRLLE